MNKQRRAFLSQLSVIAGAVALNKPLASAAAITKSINTLSSGKSGVTVYHTNDLNGHTGPVYKNMGGLNHIRLVLKNQEVSGLLLDAGNFLNGRKNILHQAEVISVMNAMGYHAAAIGENELMGGQEHLMSLIPRMNFSLLNCNFQFDNNLARLVKPFVIIYSGNFKIGITGVCHKIKGIKYNDAIESANRVARLLKEDKKCDLVICLSHLGQKQYSNISDNQKLAEQSENIDIVIGGNIPRINFNSLILANKLKQEVVLAQTGSNGLLFGKTTVSFDSEKKKTGIKSKHFIPGMPENQSYAAALSTLQLANNPQV
jgi:5'-nucleotidase